MKFKLITILAFIWLTPVMAYTQSIIYVKPGGTGDGSTWEKATSDLHAVMQQPYTTIWVASGVYYGDTVTYNPNAFVVAEGVKIYGSFVGNEPENYDLSLRDFGQHPTVLDGKGKKRVLYSKDFDDVLACKGSTDSIIVDGFVFQNGMSGFIYAENYFHGGGGACVISTHFSNCVFRENRVPTANNTHYGIGIFAFRSSLTHCKITNNYAYHCNFVQGVGFYAENSELTNCEIVGNRADVSDQNQGYFNIVYGVGGYLFKSKIKGSKINHNIAVLQAKNTGSMAAGICVDTAIMEDCEVAYDSIIGGENTSGGGFLTEAAMILDVRCHHNYAAGAGGASVRIGTVVQNSEFYNNSSTDWGGGLYVNNSWMRNTTVYNNSTNGIGGGMYVNDVSFRPASQFINSNAVCNFSKKEGAGVYNNTQTPFCCTNSIFWGNKSDVANSNLFGDFNISHSAVEGGFQGTDNICLASANQGIAADSQYVAFVLPSDKAGVTIDYQPTWKLTDASVCIDKGMADTSGLNLPLTDLGGDPRIYNHRIDIGAYEYFPGTSIHAPLFSESHICVYPNPAKQFFYITNGERYENTAYEITDMTGRIVMQGRYNAADGIRVSGLAKGIYLLRMEGKVGKFGKN